ncbi:lactosylceramide 4-alpha-galactosyltransferase-like [Ornithodoros turicata]|uniref:lactosylceramide 4-alpha-galactosyltransferase-like n=1 Tax=Ornithodoros turicata TaxID=34597 RepID=UPI0031395AEB
MPEQRTTKPRRKHFNETTDNIFFLETAGSTCINARQSCAIESAALRNPATNIVFLTAKRMTWRCKLLDVLTQIPNFQQHSAPFEDLFRGTVLESWHENGPWRRSPFRVNHLSDALRLVVLWKFGGAYADLDVVVLEDMSTLKNSVARELFPAVGNTVMVFDKGHPFLLDCMKEFSVSYKPTLWAYNGPRLLERVLLKYCSETALRSEPYVNCSGVTVLPDKAFYPVRQTEWEALFRPEDLSRVLNATYGSYTVHFWNSSSKTKRLSIGLSSAYDVLSRFSCPATYRFAKHQGQV